MEHIHKYTTNLIRTRFDDKHLRSFFPDSSPLKDTSGTILYPHRELVLLQILTDGDVAQLVLQHAIWPMKLGTPKSLQLNNAQKGQWHRTETNKAGGCS